MRIVEVFAAAVEAVGSLQVSRLHRVIDVLHIHHLRGVQVYVQLLSGQFHPLELLCEHREVEFGGVESCQVAVLKPIGYLVGHFVEGRAVHEHVVGNAVNRRG